jgi:hypothetical protein
LDDIVKVTTEDKKKLKRKSKPAENSAKDQTPVKQKRKRIIKSPERDEDKPSDDDIITLTDNEDT